MPCRLLLFLCAFLFCLPYAAQAQSSIDVTLTPPLVTGQAGSTVTITGTLDNFSANDMYINGIDAPSLPLGIFLDASPLDLSFPVPVASGDSASGDLFDVQIDSALAPGDYSGFFFVTGGLDNIAQDDISDQIDFTIHVVPASVPEPVTPLVLGGLLTLSGLMTVRRRQHA